MNIFLHIIEQVIRRWSQKVRWKNQNVPKGGQTYWCGPGGKNREHRERKGYKRRIKE